MAELKAVKYLGPDLPDEGLRPVRFLGDEPSPIPEPEPFGGEFPVGDPSQALALGRRHVLPMVLPTLGQVGGGFAGGLLASPTVAGVPAGVLGGEMVGGAIGESANQLLGITEPSKMQIALAGGAGPIGRGIGAAGGALLRQAKRLPGAGVALRDWAAKTAERFGPSLRPGTSSDELYAIVDRMNPKVDLTPVKEVVARLAKQQAPRAEFGVQVPGGVGRVIQKTGRALEPPEPTVSPLIDPTTGRNFIHEVEEAVRHPIRNFQDIRAVMRGINDKIGALKTQGGEGFGEMLQLKKAFAESLEQTEAAGPAHAALKAANKAFRQEIASDTVTDIVNKNIQLLEGRETVSISAGRAIKALQEAVRKDPFLRESFAPGSYDRIINGLEQIRKLPLPGAPPGVDAGSKRGLRQAAFGTAVGGAAWAAGADPLIATVTPFATMLAADAISQGLATKRGTDLLLWALREGKGLNRPMLSLIMAAARSELGGSQPEGMPSLPGPFAP